MIRVKDRIEYKVKEWSKEVKADKEKRIEVMKKNIDQLSNEIGGYFRSKAKSRSYFYAKG